MNKENWNLCALNRPKKTLDSFVVTEETLYAVELIKMAADYGMAGIHNPIFICGDHGMGKSHLLQAYANLLIDNGKTLKIYSGESFIDKLVMHMEEEGYTTNGFCNLFNNVDGVFVEDVTDLLNNSVKNELVRVVNKLRTQGKIIAFTSVDIPELFYALLKDKVKYYIDTDVLELRISTYEQKHQIIETMAKEMGLDLTEETIESIANSVENGHQVESVLRTML